MTWQIKAGLYLVLVIAIFLAGWKASSDHYGKIYQTALAQSVQLQLDAVAEHDKLKHDAEVQHGTDQILVNNLRNQLADRLRIHIPTCEGTAPSKNSNGSAGAFSARVDAAFAKLQSGVDRLAARCDQLNIDAIAVNKSLGY